MSKNHDQGEVEIYIDDFFNPVATVDTRFNGGSYRDDSNGDGVVDTSDTLKTVTINGVRLNQQIIFEKYDLSSGSHTVRVRNKTNGKVMRVDAFAIDNPNI